MKNGNAERTVGRTVSYGPEETREIAGELARELSDGAVLALHGDLGAGKTCFVQGLARACGVDQPVTSPTFTLINEYRGRRRVYHIDLYRIADPEELRDLGWEQYMEPDGITVVEWAERAADAFPGTAIHIRFDYGKEPEERILCFDRGGAPCSR
ncbi:tRNA (adenosine(37)-N6)-threonylcarbamoyltransferase complex ATPase subunit type 1 TsaE [Kiritimatiella glycovorans]|uniref:tRNA threonylcarbamoyladenosine biosynthesis protein TsaE n=1 Tax=Kiritimatiella glycovorans TaxID=1307763 RepID=A0A0G3EHP9_9BACT|nr:tRNA (adenosine(37)-N6)-threonylcarbamoyltransferase complex ATPase subunit type 1 TsaE [Kiritimatiella glycovorans]AKJ64320.1 ADP-binding protein [Kiritimatiella glycovorans]